MYPIKHDEAIYEKNVSIIRMSEMRNNKQINIFKCSFIACPALKGISSPLTKEENKIINEKIELIFQIAIENKHNSIILGGCGIFCCDPKIIANKFKIICNKYKKYINIYFCILGKNYNIFNDILIS